MLVGDAAAPRIIRVMLEKVDGAWQGACVDFLSGNGLRNGTNRMAFSPSGKELYVGQTMREWAGAMEGLQRVVFRDGKVFEVLRMHLQSDGFEFEFTEPVDPGNSDSPEAFSTESYWYQYASKYGGDEVAKQKETPKSVHWSADRRKARVVYEGISAQRVYRVTLRGLTSSETPLGHATVAYTVNRVAK
jgi:hypothetical protein